MTTPAEDLRNILDNLETLIGLEHVKDARLGDCGRLISVGLDTCDAYRLVCAAHKAKPGQPLRNPSTAHRAWQADCGRFIANHHCFPSMACWPEEAEAGDIGDVVSEQPEPHTCTGWCWSCSRTCHRSKETQ